MRISSFLGALVASMCLAACSRADSPVAPDTSDHAPITVPDTVPTRPNLIVLLADDQRWDAIGAAGNPVIQTPNLDALAHAGVYFKNAYVTSPICMISRASIFTGQYARRHEIVDFPTDLSSSALAQTYPALLRAAGYRSGFIGKFGVGDHPPADAFDYWRGFAGQGTYEQTDSAGRPIHLTRLMTQQAVSFLEAQKGDKPFVLSVSFKAPHPQDEDPRQFIPDQGDMGMYAGVTIPTPATAADRYWQAMPAFFRKDNLARERWVPLFSTPEKFQASARNYYRLVSGMDRAVGEIRAALERLKLDRNTVIIYTSDNGFFLGDFGLAHKWFGYDPSVRVPLIVYDPRRPASERGRVDPSIALNIDVAPTLLDLAGVGAPGQMQGRTLMPLVRGEAPIWRQDFFFEEMYPHPQIPRSSGVIGGRYKYLRYVDQKPAYEQLFDLQTDPNETADLARDPSFLPVLESMRGRYDALLAQAR
jgi:arylsulfatase A-like enzyme